MTIDCFARLAELLPDALLLVDTAGRVKAANEAAARLLKRHRNRLVGQQLALLVLEEDEALASLLRSGSRTRARIPGVLTFRQEGEPALSCPCEAALYERSTRENLPLVMLRLLPRETAANRFLLLNDRVDQLSREVARRRAAEADLQAYSERLLVTLRSITDAVVAVDANGRVSLMNPVAQTLTGWTQEEAAQHRIEDVFVTEDALTREPKEDLALKVLHDPSHSLQSPNALLVARDGTERHVESTAAPIRTDDGQLVGAVLVFRDISERYRLERETALYATKLVEADQRKNEFLSMLAHELRNPLAPLRTGAYLLMHMQSATALQPIAQMMERQVAHMSRLIDDLLDVARLTQGRIELRKAAVPLRQVIQEAVEMCRPQFAEGGPQLSVAAPPEHLVVHADKTRLIQVVGNLLNNASKFTPARGEVWLQATVEGSDAVVRVRDTGMGIDPSLLPHVFDLFVQGARSLDRAYGGLGIGLSVVKRIVEMHAGRVEAHSEGKGQGSEFVVRIPALQGPRSALEEAGGARTSMTGSGPLRILIVDDNQDAAESLSTILCLWGHACRVATSGTDALQTWEQFRPDVALLDIGLPGMSGYELARHVRSLPNGTNPILIAVTGYGSKEDQEASTMAGFDAHLTKPVDLGELERLLSLERADARDTSGNWPAAEV